MNQRTLDRILLASIGVLTVIFAFVLSSSLKEHFVKEGDDAVSFKVRSDSGRTVTASEFGGKVLILNIWATWCPPCITELPSLDRLQRSYGSRGLVVLGVSWDQDLSIYKQFLARNRLSIQTAIDSDREIGTSYGTMKIPESYIIDRSGKVLKKIVGPANWTDPQMTAYVESLL